MTKVLLFVLPVLVGLALLALARWARLRNRTLVGDSGDSNHDAWLTSFRNRRYGTAARLFFFGSLSSTEKHIGNGLALAVVVLLVAGLLLLAFLLGTR